MNRLRDLVFTRAALLSSLVTAGGLALAVAAPSARAADFKPTAQANIVPEGAGLELLFHDGDFTEGPAPDAAGDVFFSDIGDRVLKFSPRDKQVTVFRAPSGKANGLMFDVEGRLLACEGAGGGNRRVSRTEKDGTVVTLADRWNGKRFNSPNDLAIAPGGRIYFTDPRYGGSEPRELDFEGVFLIEPSGEVKLATKEAQRPNGVLATPDGKTVYVADNHSDADKNHHLLAFRVAEDGTLVDKKILFDIGPNRRGIDGMTLDEAGAIYATAGTGKLAGVYVFGPAGEHLAFLPTPGDPTNCVFGRGDEARTLYITAGGPVVEGKPRRFALYRIPLKRPGYRVEK